MSIQFQCPGCSQPIEVDRQYASQSAQCPYCSRVITVPSFSTLPPDEIPKARSPGEQPPEAPIAPGPSGDRGGLHVGPTQDPRLRAARRYGIASLVLGIISVVFIGVCLTLAAPILEEMAERYDAGDPAAIEDLQQEMLDHPDAPYIVGTGCSGPALAVFGLILAIVSLRQGRRGNWPGWLGAFINGAITLYMFFGLARIAITGA